MTISDEAVEAAVNAHGRAHNPKWDHPIMGYQTFSEDQKGYLRDQARHYLEAAAPSIRAEALEEAAHSLGRPDAYPNAYAKGVQLWLRARAAEMRQG